MSGAGRGAKTTFFFADVLRISHASFAGGPELLLCPEFLGGAAAPPYRQREIRGLIFLSRRALWGIGSLAAIPD
jgi:hypothetical protein